MTKTGARLLLAAGLAISSWPPAAAAAAAKAAYGGAALSGVPPVPLPISSVIPLAVSEGLAPLRPAAALAPRPAASALSPEPGLGAVSTLEQAAQAVEAGAAESYSASALSFDGGPRSFEGTDAVLAEDDGSSPAAALAPSVPESGASPAPEPPASVGPDSYPGGSRASLLSRLRLSSLLLLHGLAVHTGVLAKTADAWAQAEASRFLRRFSTIRVGVDKAPGNGHQAVSATIVRRLRRLGFEGRLEVVYHPRTKSKLGFLLPGFDPDGPRVQELPEAGIRAIDSDSLTAGDYERHPLGIVGATDGLLPPQWLKVDHLLTVQPFQWDRASVHGAVGQDGAWKRYLGLQAIPLRLDLPAPQQPGEFVAAKMSGAAGLSAKSPSLVRLVEARGRVETLPAYGLGMEDSWRKLLRIVKGVRYAQRARPGRFRGGVVIPLISRLDDQDAGRLAAGVRADAALRQGVSVADIEDPETSRRIDELQAGEILIVRVGVVAQEVFEYLFANATLPPAVAGSNGINLMVAARKPFLKTTPGGAGSGFITSLLRYGALRARRLVRRAYSELRRVDFRDDPETSGRALGEFILASLDGRSALRRAFGRSRPLALERDKLAEALLRGARIMALGPLSPLQGLYRGVAALRSLWSRLLRGLGRASS